MNKITNNITTPRIKYLMLITKDNQRFKVNKSITKMSAVLNDAVDDYDDEDDFDDDEEDESRLTEVPCFNVHSDEL